MLAFRNRAFSKHALSRILFRNFSSQAPSQTKLFDKILIANRGEIACRVIKTCKKLGIKSVAVYSEPDANSLHVKMADEAVCVGPAIAAQSYINIDNIMAAIHQTGAQAVHPGYGFLSENYLFAERLAAEGVAFIGPEKKAIVSMGDKIASKKIAQEAKVNIIPGFLGAVDTNEEVIKIANDIGYPVMIKASAGGGGKGMRVAWNDEEAKDGFRLSRQEAAASFGDDTIFLEKFIESPRHIEIQVLCDGHGNGLWVNERECSIQRRNQKVIEEAPSVFLDQETRRMMGEQAVALAKAVDYKSAGTVEFIVNDKREFYFLEMNTRLQVEHPVTEYITGVDLVEEMIKVAAGRKLDLKQDDIGIKGWSVESRVYAEDPLKDFLPSIGTLEKYQEPTGNEQVHGLDTIRVDTGVEEGGEISIYYDPLISKLVTYGKDRESAIQTMRDALDSYVIRGVTSNISFLRALMDHPRFLSGDMDTKFIEDEYPEGFLGNPVTPTDVQALATVAACVHTEVTCSKVSLDGQRDDFDRFDYVGDKTNDLVVKVDDTELLLSAINEDDYPRRYRVINSEGAEAECEVTCDYVRSDTLFEAETNGEKRIMQMVDLRDGDRKYTIQYKGTRHTITCMTPTEAAAQALMPIPEVVDTSRVIMSPMPGSVFSVNVQEGDEVNPGQEVCVVEAMKMQNAIRVDRKSTVKKVLVKPGDTVQADDVLLELE